MGTKVQLKRWDGSDWESLDPVPADHTHEASDIIDGDFTNIDFLKVPAIKLDGQGEVSIGDGDQGSVDAAQDSHGDRFMFYIDSSGTFSNGFGLRTHDDTDNYNWMFKVDHDGTLYAGDNKVATEQYVDDHVEANTNNYVDGVSGSGNGTLTLTRDGLDDLEADLSHSHSGYASSDHDHDGDYVIGDYEVQKNGSDGDGIINFKT